jgi:hypothetical protein
MAAPPSAPTPPKSRGHTLFDRQAQLHAHDSDKSSNPSSTTIFDIRLPQQKSIQPLSSSPITYRHQYSPLLPRRQSPLSSSECYPNSNNNNNVQLIGIHPRPESTYIKEWPLPPVIPSKTSEQQQQFLETDFPLVENSTKQESETSADNIIPSDSLCCAMIEQAFDYLKTHDDNDDVVYQRNTDGYDNEENSDGADSVDTIDLDATTSTNHPNDSKFYYSSLSSNQITSGFLSEFYFSRD